MKITSVYSGLIWGIVFVSMYLVGYIVGTGFMENLNWILIILGTTMLVYFGNQKKKSLEGYISFGQSFGFMCLTVLIGLTVSTSFNLLLFYVFDPGYMDHMKELAVDRAVEQSESRGASDEQIEMGLKFIDFIFSWVGQLLFTGLWLLFWFVVSFICSLVIKKKRPEFA